MRRLTLLFLLTLLPVAGAEPLPLIVPDAPAWTELAATFASRPDASAEFTEKRFFPFRKAPLELSGVSRVSTARGLSLDYTAPEKRTVILDVQGMLVRQADGESAAPADPRASAANAALVHILRFDLAALARNFDLFGRRDGATWALTLVPRAEDLRRVVAEIAVTGEATDVRHIVIRRSAKQYVEITIGVARPAPFTAEELQRFFR